MFGNVTPCVLVKGQWSASVMWAQRESSVPRTSKVQGDDVALYKSLLEGSKVMQDGILLGNLGIVTVDVDIELRKYKVMMSLFVLVSFRAIKSCVVLESSSETSVS